MENKIRWGIIAPGSIAATFAESLKSMDDGILTAITASRLNWL